MRSQSRRISVGVAVFVMMGGALPAQSATIAAGIVSLGSAATEPAGRRRDSGVGGILEARIDAGRFGLDAFLVEARVRSGGAPTAYAEGGIAVRVRTFGGLELQAGPTARVLVDDTSAVRRWVQWRGGLTHAFGLTASRFRAEVAAWGGSAMRSGVGVRGGAWGSSVGLVLRDKVVGAELRYAVEEMRLFDRERSTIERLLLLVQLTPGGSSDGTRE